MYFKSSAELILSQSLVYVQNTSDFVLFIMKERLLDPASTLVCISLDSGGSFMKVVINVFNPEQERSTENYNNSGVQRSQILAISEDISESNYNLRIILDRLNLQDVKFSIAFDL